MKKFKGAGRKPATLSRSNTTSSIRGKISAPIPHPTADDEFPIREPGTSIATPLGHEDFERHLRSPPTPLQVDIAQHEKPEEEDMPAPAEELSRAAPSVHTSTVPSQETPIPQARQSSPLRGSGVSNPSGSSLEKPQRKKSTLRTVLGRLFGKKRKSDSSANRIQEESARAGLHRSVSIICYINLSCMLTPFRIPLLFESQAARHCRRNVQLLCLSMILTEL
jgi:hypothetical protein